jgi:hypothetical protein
MKKGTRQPTRLAGVKLASTSPGQARGCTSTPPSSTDVESAYSYDFTACKVKL